MNLLCCSVKGEKLNWWNLNWFRIWIIHYPHLNTSWPPVLITVTCLLILFATKTKLDETFRLRHGLCLRIHFEIEYVCAWTLLLKNVEQFLISLFGGWRSQLMQRKTFRKYLELKCQTFWEFPISCQNWKHEIWLKANKFLYIALRIEIADNVVGIYVHV